MKKVILSVVTAVFSTNMSIMADEFFIGGGYDFYRKTGNKIDESKKIKSGIKLGAEWLPYENNNIKIGLGVSHSFNIKARTGSIKWGNISPVYLVVKPEWKNSGDWKIYNKYKIGWAFNSKPDIRNSEKKAIYSDFKSGPYIGIEVGTEWKNISFGLAYDINNISHKNSTIHQVGITIGYVFNNDKPYKMASPYSIKNNKLNNLKAAPVEIQPVTSSDIIEKRTDTEQNIQKDYKKWFSLDEEINK